MEPQDWRVRVDQAVARAQAQRTPPRGRASLSTRFRGSAGVIIREAAAARGLTTAAFIRRSALAFAAVVLDRDYDDVVAYDNRIQREGFATAEDPSGRLCGPWEITGLR